MGAQRKPATGLHMFLKLLYGKGNNYQREDTTYKMAENVSSYSSDKTLISRIYKI